ncbi:kin of IRRE-like protein 3 [Limulus polyphemus]|uniref:Kin of IRRE-like protein 3 n=1 Tax=Limulus polyphemus TaxID=6850 RepID=A0ABM1TSG6_LIMPO|nr:kin of IRRE-like protein 3 [Limulus polyphemus]
MYGIWTFSCFCAFVGQLWLLSRGAHVKQKPASKEKPYASILYTAVVGGKVALPCDISSPATDDSAALILWYKGESAQPIYTLDARRDRVNQARQSVSPQLQNRAYFNMINRPAFLQLDPVRLEDAGEYRCRIDFHKARTINTVITLKVIVPPADPLVLNEEGKELKGTIGPFNEGDTIKLLCKSIGGKPRPSVTWWKEEILLDDSYTFKPNDVVDNELIITKAKREDLMSVLTCKASNSNITVPGSVSITLDLNLKPKTVKVQSSKRPLSADVEVELRCSSSGSRPAADITWWKGNEQLQQTSLTVDKVGVRTSILKFTPSITDDGKYLSCRAENPFIPSNAVEDGWRLEVYYNPQLSLELGARIKKDDVKEGDDVYFECHIRSNPWVSQVFWHFEGQSLTSNSSIGIIITNQTLVIQRIRREYRGRYSCSAQNIEGLGVSNEIFLKVKYVPRCSPTKKYTYGVAINEAVQVLCQLDADPSDVTFHWRFNNTTSKHSDAIQYTSNQGESVATYTPKTEEDFGNLFCWGANNIGIQKSPCIFSIVSAGPPNPLQNCSVLNQTEKQITVECLQEYDEENAQQFSLEVYSVEDNRLQANLTSKFPRFQIRDLPEGTQFRLFVYAWNAKGKSDVVVISAHTHKPADKLTDNGNTEEEVVIRPLLIALIGVVAVLVVVAVVIVILKKYRKRRERKAGQSRRSLPDKSQTPLWKDVSDLSELDDKGPDIIPAQTLSRSNYGEFAFIMGEDDERRKKSISLISPMEIFYGSSSLLEGTSLSKEACHSISSPIESVSVQPLVLLKKQEDTSYEGLTSTITTHCSEDVMSNGSGPECSKTGLRRHLPERDEEECGATCETPLMESRQESAV